MAEASYLEALTKWVDDHSWPRPTSGPTDGPRVILILTGVATSGTIFKFQSALGYFEVTAYYHKARNSLTSVRVAFVVPGYTKAILLTGSDSYALSTKDGVDLPFKIGRDVIYGKLSFKYVDPKGAPRNISMKYNANVPFAGNLEDTISLSPAELSSGFTTAELETIPVLTSSELQLEEAKALAYPTDVAQTQYHATDSQQECKSHLIVVLQYTGDGDKVVLVGLTNSEQCLVSINFLSIFELVASIDSKTFTTAAGLFVRIPFVGRVHITNIEGSLGSAAEVVAEINTVFAKGSAKLTAEKNNEGKHVLFVSLALSVRFIGNITSGGKLHLLTLSF